MEKKKLTSLAILTILIASIFAVYQFIPTVSADPDPTFTATISPLVASGSYPYPSIKYTISINSTHASDWINKTDITYPAAWTYVSHENITDFESTNDFNGTHSSATHSVNFTTASTEFKNGVYLLKFNVTVNPTTAGNETWTLRCWMGTTEATESPMSLYTYVTPWFDATISPTLVKAAQKPWFDIQVTNNASTASIYKVVITYNTTDGWAFNDLSAPTGWSLYSHIGATATFTASGGYELASPSGSATFRFNMTTGTPSGDDRDYTWVVNCTNTAAKWSNMTMTVNVDKTAPSITVDHPAGGELTEGYSVGAGNYIWINITITDNYYATPTLYINASFTYTIEYQTGTTYDWKAYFKNSSAIQDGTLKFFINATDVAGNVGSTTGYPTPISVDINNIAPTIIDIIVCDVGGNPLPEPTPGKFYMDATETTIQVNVTVYDPHFDTTNSKVYHNNTYWYTLTSSTNKTLQSYAVGTANYVNITVVTYDTASPNSNNYNETMEVFRDTQPPSTATFDTPTAVCGGAIVKSITAIDDVGILGFDVWVNGTSIYITNATLWSTTLYTIDTVQKNYTFSGILVLNLTGCAGGIANLTIRAKDFGGNYGNWSTPALISVPEGTFYPIVLQPKWNLISLPLIPTSSAREDILSLVLKQGPGGVIVTYGYDQYIDDWITNPAELTDGWGYWLYILEYDVLIVQGTEMPPPPALPPTYLYTEGWVLAGFKSTAINTIANYIESLESASYFPHVYVWDASAQNWDMLATTSESLNPGQGFWIWMYEDQYLIPPI